VWKKYKGNKNNNNNICIVLKYETETRNDAHRRDMGHVGANNLISPATLIINLFMFMLGQVAVSSVSLTVCCDSRQLRQRHMNI